MRAGYEILRDTILEYIRDDGPFICAGIAFYALFSLFPITLIGFSVLGYMLPADAHTSQITIEMAHYYLPSNLVGYVETTVRDLGEDRGKLGIFGLLALLWSGRHLFRALELSLHRAWDIPLNRGFFSGNLISVLLILLCAGVTFVVALISAVLTFAQATLSHLDLPQVFGISLADTVFWGTIHSWFVMPMATLAIFMLLYIILPSQQVPVAAALPGAVFATVIWKLVTWVYLAYVIRFIQLNPVYGSIWGLAGLMIWLYLGAAVFMLGAEMVNVLLSRNQAPGRRRRRSRS